MAGTEKKRKFSPKPDVVVNPRATWFKRLEELMRSLEDGEAGDLPRIPKKQFEAADKTKEIKLLKGMLDVLFKKARIPTDGNLICPFHEDINPSMVYNNLKFDLHCFSCHEYGETRDIFDLIRLFFGTKSFPEQKLLAIELLVEDGASIARTMRVKTQKASSNRSSVPMERPSAASRSFSRLKESYYSPAWEDEDCRNYLIQRGITEESAKQFGLKCWKYNGVSYIVIPCEGDFVVRRNINAPLKPKYWLKKGVPVSLFNSKRLQSNGTCIFVTEGAFDAITIEQIGYPAIALNGKGFYGKLIEQSGLIRKNGLYLIVLPDNDIFGKDAGRILIDRLQEHGIRSYLHEYTNTGIGKFLVHTKDINDAYQLDPDQATDAIREIYRVATELSRIKPADSRIHYQNPVPNPLASFGITGIINIKDMERIRNGRIGTKLE